MTEEITVIKNMSDINKSKTRSRVRVHEKSQLASYRSKLKKVSQEYKQALVIIPPSYSLRHHVVTY